MGSVVYTDPIESLDYGSYTCEMSLTAPGFDIDPIVIKHELSFTKGKNSTILTVPFYETTAT
jgi:hypothetical protein